MSATVRTFGCRLNLVEGERLQGLLNAGPARDLVVFNSCGVTGEAVRQLRQSVRRARREQPGAQIVVTGCAAETDREALSAMPEIDALVPNAEKLDPVRWGVAAAQQPVRLAGRSRAFVDVQTGCDHHCTFCVIPVGRGPSRSRPAAETVARVRDAAEAGAAEVVLTGVDLTSYRDGDVTLGLLVRRILRDVPDLPRLRLSSLDSVEIDHDLLDAFASQERLMPHLHLSLQAGDDMILRRMKRRHRRADALALARQVRRLRPDVAFGADLIAGFPTETEAMFANSLALVAEIDIIHLHVFPFSARPGAPASRMPQTPGPIVQQRAAALRAAGQAALDRRAHGEIGERRAVLVERGDVGHTPAFLRVRAPAGATPGTLMTLRMGGYDDGWLVAA